MSGSKLKTRIDRLERICPVRLPLVLVAGMEIAQAELALLLRSIDGETADLPDYSEAEATP